MHAFSRTVSGHASPVRPAQLREQPQAVSFHAAGSEIYGQGERAKCLYQVEFGAVRVYRLLADGRRQISAFYLAGETFGFEADAVHHFFADALVATGIRIIRPSATDMAAQLLPLALRSLTRAQEHLLVLGRQSAVERVAAFLLDLAERQGGFDHVDIPMSRIDIGDYLGLTIETVSRAFSRLKQDRIIRLLSSRSVEIVRRKTLSDMSE